MRINSNNEIEYVQLSKEKSISKEQYEAISELIYDTDPYIYPVMFGDGSKGKQCAIQLLPTVFENGQDEMFSKDNLYVVERDKDVIGLILWYKGELIWNPESLLKIAEYKKIRLDKEKIELVRKEYVESCYKNNELSIRETVSLINVCVGKEMRGLGIGSMLLKSFINNHIGEEMELTVLANNAPAVKLYQKFGFKTVRKEEGFALVPKKPLCLTMQRSCKGNR